MKIPFFDRFKKGRAPKEKPNVFSKSTSISKPEGERLSKTVMPSTARAAITQEAADGASEMNEGTFEAPSATPRAISFGPKKTPAGKDLPPAVALALEPRVERAISLDLADVFNQLPVGLTKPLESLDPTRRILLKASELEKKMSMGKPSVALQSIYSQAPEIFLKAVAPHDTTEVALPFDKVLEAFMQMQVRRDQTSDENVPQMETPFLQVSKEDSEKFGVPNEPLKASAKPPLRVEAATAPTIAAAEPEASTKFVPIPATAEAIAAANPEAAAAADRVLRIPAPVQPEKPLRIPLATQPVAKGKSETAGKAAPERIAFHLPPKGTGAPASERVPASSGPPVSTDVAPPTRPSTLASGVQLPRKLGVASAPPMPQISTTDDKKISLALKAILQSLPVFELSGDPKEVPEETRVEFPFSLIHSQLSTGRVAVPPELFEKALPPEGRRFFTAKNLQMPVQLPLQEVLRNLPGDALRMRDDQEVREIGETIETPFSTAASEDAERFGAKPQSLSQPEPQLDISPAANVAAPRNDAKSIVEQINALPGVRACSLTFSDGLSLAGALPAEINADALCAVAPSLLERVQTHLVDAQIGELKTITLHCEAATISFLKNANICLTALHANGELTDDVRNKLSEMLAELSRNYPQNEASHVDH